MQVSNLSGRLAGGRNNAVLLGILAAVAAAILLIIFIVAYRGSVKDDKPLTTVFVAKQLIKSGTTGTQIASKALYTPTQVVVDQVKPGAILDPAQMNGRTLQTDVFPGTQISDADFAAPAQTGAVGGQVSSALTGSARALTVTLDAINGSLALVAVGDHVDIYQQLTSGGAQVIKLVRADVPVLQNDGASNVVLRVKSIDVPDVLYAAKHTDLFFVVRPTNGAKPTVPRIASTATMRYDRTH
jgi:Flp pilus assembly protein CpaB